jgi:ribosomal protein L32
MSKRRRIIEGKWGCESCGSKEILGRHKVCPNCGNPRDAAGQESTFDFGQSKAGAPSTSKTVDDSEALELAAAGVDWYCPYCESGNRGDGNICVQCGADRSTHTSSNTEPHKSEEPPVKKASILTLGALVSGFVVCAGCCGLGFWGSQTQPVKGQVSKVAWTHTIEVEQFQPAQKEGWREELAEHPSKPPVNGQGEVAGVQNIRDCTQKLHSHRSVADGEEEVCRDVASEYECGVEESCTISDLGNGFAEEVCEESVQYCTQYEEVCSIETKYRQEPIYKEWCVYDTMTWVKLEPRSKSGEDSAPVWPDVSELRLIRETRSSTYSVHFQVKVDGESHDWEYKPESESDFVVWPLGEEAELEINNFGNIGFPGSL